MSALDNILYNILYNNIISPIVCVSTMPQRKTTLWQRIYGKHVGPAIVMAKAEYKKKKKVAAKRTAAPKRKATRKRKR